MLDSLTELINRPHQEVERDNVYLDWLDLNIMNYIEEYIVENRLLSSSFYQVMSRAFDTDKIDRLVKKWLLLYFMKMFKLFDGCIMDCGSTSEALTLNDNQLNRYIAKIYYDRSKQLPVIRWKREKLFYYVL